MIIVVFKHTLSKQYLNKHRIQLWVPYYYSVLRRILLFKNVALQKCCSSKMLLFKNVLLIQSTVKPIIEGYHILLLFKHIYRNNFLLRRWDFNTFNNCTCMRGSKSKEQQYWTLSLFLFMSSSSRSKAQQYGGEHTSLNKKEIYSILNPLDNFVHVFFIQK